MNGSSVHGFLCASRPSQQVLRPPLRQSRGGRDTFAAVSRGMSRAQVAESSFSFLHMELVQMALGPLSASGQQPSTSQLQQASRKIEAIGFQVGVRLIERYTRDRPRFSDTLEIIKFICKDFWMEVYKKQVDKLQTNNRVSNTCVCHFSQTRLMTHGPKPYIALAPLTPPSLRLRLSAHGCDSCSMFFAGRLHAAGQCTPRARALLALGAAAGDREAARGAAHQVSERPHSRCAQRARRYGLRLSRSERPAALSIHHQNPSVRVGP